MKEVKIKLFTFDELSKDAQHNVCERDRLETYGWGYICQEHDASERLATLDKFCEVFGIKYDIDYDHQHRFISWHFEDSELEANIFASYLIMPYEGLERYYKTNNIVRWTLEDTIRAEQFFQMSHHAMLFRLREQEFITKEECLNFRKVLIGYEARINGFSDDLYVQSDESKKYYSLGKYIRLVEKAFTENKISDGKRDELLLDAFRSDLTFNFNEK